MALKATIYKADLNIANMDDHIYGDYQLTLALHPSETLERLIDLLRKSLLQVHPIYQCSD